MNEYRFKSIWRVVVDRAHVRKMVLPKMPSSLALREVGLGAQYADYDLNRFKEEDWEPSVSDTVCTDSVQCICHSMEYEDLVA